MPDVFVTVTNSATINVTITGGAGGPGGAGSGTVTSVGLALPAIFTVSGSPVLSVGTLTGTLATQSANTVFSGPNNGSAAAPTFRALVAADIPTIAQSQVTNLTTDLAAKQPLDSDLTAIAGLTASNDDFLQRKSGAWANRTVAQVKSDLGLTGTNSGDQTITLTGDVTGSGTGSFAATIASGAVTFAKMQAVSANILLGNDATGTAVEEITCTAAGRALLDDADAAAQRTTLGLGTLATQNGTFSGTSSGTNTGDQTITLTGDVTGSGTGSFAATIANDAVTFAKMQNISTGKLLGRYSSGSGDAQEITISTGLSLDGSGNLTATGGGGGGGTVTSVGLSLPAIFSVSGSPVTTSGTLTGSLATQTANTIFAGPNTGSAAAPTFRALVSDDIPTLAQSKITDLTTDLAGKQPLDSDLTAIAALSASNDDFLQRKSGAWANRTVAQVKSDLGLTGTNTGDQTITLTGDVTGSGTGSFAATIASGAVTFAKMQAVSANILLGNDATGTAVEEITCTAAGRALLDDADAAAQRTTLGLGTLATQNGTFSGTSSGTNTGDQTITLTGDVTGTGTGSFAVTIQKHTAGILVSDPNGDAITTGDGKAYIRAHTALNGLNLTAVAASVSTVSSSGAVTVQIRRVRSGYPVDMLSTALTIDASENDSSTAATAAVINTSNDDIATADQIYIDIDGAGTGAKGLFITLTFSA